MRWKYDESAKSTGGVNDSGLYRVSAAASGVGDSEFDNSDHGSRRQRSQ
jgi:hypothetical protein